MSLNHCFGLPGSRQSPLRLTNSLLSAILAFGIGHSGLAVADFDDPTTVLAAPRVQLSTVSAPMTASAADTGSGPDSAGPGWIDQTAELISPAAARQERRTELEALALESPTETLSVAAETLPAAMTAGPVDYVQLAEALENDPRRIYQFVRNHIEYVPYFGALKGPQLTLLERAGNDFDQAALLIELLRAAGYSANYQFGTMDIPISAADGRDMANWLGSEPDGNLIGRIVASGGIPATYFVATQLFEIERVWVVAQIGSQTVELDPAFKPSIKTQGIDLATAMGYDQLALLGSAGGTPGTDSIQGLNEAALDAYLDGLTNTLVGYLKTNHPNAEVEEIIGGLEIVPDHSDMLPGGLPFAGTPTEPEWTDIPAAYVHTVRIEHGGIDTTQNIPDIAGKKLSISYVGGTVIDPPPPDVDLDFGSVAPDGSTDRTLSGITNPNSVSVQIDVTLSGSNAFSFVSGGGLYNVSPGAALPPTVVRLSGTAQTAGRKNATLTYSWSYQGSVFATNNYRLTGVIQDTPLAELHLDDQLLVAETVATGDTSVLSLSIDHPYSGSYGDQTGVVFNLDRTNGTYVLASAFGGDRNSRLLRERQRHLNQLLSQGLANDSREVLTENLNVIGQTWMQQTQLNADLLAAITDHRMIRHHRFGIVGQEAGYFIDVKAQFASTLPQSQTALEGAFQAGGFIASAMEHSVLEQLQGADNPAVSTVELFALNNQAGDRFFLANQGNFAAIRPQLTGYSTQSLDNLQARANVNGTTLILPENGQIDLNDWIGEGYVEYRIDGSSRRHLMAIGGGLNGGFAGLGETANAFETQAESIAEITPPAQVPVVPALDPVDLVSGAFLSRLTDLSIPGAGTPGLAFTRLYNSQQADRDAVGLGRGWTHSYDIYLSEHSDVEAALGMRTPLDAAPLLVAAYATRDLMEAAQPPIAHWVGAALVADWAMDQLLDNAITVHLGDRTLTFRELPDGRFAPPPGVTTELLRRGDGTFELRERFGTVIEFNAERRIERLTDVDGQALEFSYSAGRLSQVSDPYGRRLTLGYTGERLTQVADHTARQITYAHTGEDLTEVFGLEGAHWQYGYDTEHRLLTVTDPVGVVIVDNTYDAADRVIAQRAPRETGTETYRLHYTGITSAEEDPLGNRTTYQFDTHGRTVAVEDPLGQIARTAYDGQGQVERTTDARGNLTRFEYDAHNNLARTIDANDAATVLSYDAQHRLRFVTDALSHVDEIDYDGEHRPIDTWDGERNHSVLHYYATGPWDGLPEYAIDPRGHRTSYTYDNYGYPRTATTESHPPVTTVYDDLGRLIRLTDQAGTQTTFTYDDRGLVIERTDPFNNTTVSSYDGLGRLTSQTDRNGDTTTVAYTASGKLDGLTYPGHTVAFDYDARDNLVSMTDPLGTTTNTYDALNRLDTTTDPNGFTVGYQYDEAGNLTQITYPGPGNKTVSYTYDALNRVSSISIDWLGVTATPSYDAAGRLTGISHFNATATSYRYDAADRLTGVRHESGNGLLVDYDFTLDPNGNRIQAAIDHEPILPGGLINRDQDQSYNSFRNRLLQATIDSTPITFAYDDEGQLQAKDGTPFTFDPAHRLTGFGANAYQYDGVGNRLVATRSGVTTRYVYDAAGNLLAEANAAGVIHRYYIHGLGLMAMVDAQTDELFVYHFDATGHTVAMTDHNQTIVNRYAYHPLGRILAKDEQIQQPFTFVGQFGVITEPINPAI